MDDGNVEEELPLDMSQGSESSMDDGNAIEAGELILYNEFRVLYGRW